MNLTHRTPGHMTAEPPWANTQSMLEEEVRRRQIFPGLSVRAYESIESTNDICTAIAQQGSRGPLVVMANHQSAGRGRQGNHWESPAGCNLLLSLLLEIPNGGHDLLSLAVSLATAEAIERAAPTLPVDCRVKWPNDILLSGCKVAGILIEKPASNVAGVAVIGIGVNVNQRSFPPELAHDAVSLATVCGSAVSRLTLATELLAALQQWLSPSLVKDTIIAQWKARCDMLGRRVSLESAGSTIHGMVEDIDPFNGLVVREDNGALRMCHAALSRMVRCEPAT